MVKKTAKKKSVKIQKVHDVKGADVKVNKSVKNRVEGINFDMNLLKKIIPVVFILFVMWFAFFVRSGPIELNGMDARIEANVYANVKNMISSQVDAQYPNLNTVYKQEEVDKIYSKVLESGVYEVEGQAFVINDIVEQNVKGVKDAFKDENGQTYLNAIDPYHFYALSSNYLKNGHTGTSLKDGEPWIDYKLAPNGRSGTYDVPFHTWLESKLYSINGVDESSTVGEKTSVIFLIPVIFVVLSVIPIYLIIRRFSNDLFALFGSLLLVSVGTFVSRTVAGFVDTDAYVVFFPLVLVAFLIYAFMSKKKIVTSILAIFAGIAQALFLWSWSAGWFIFVFVLGALLGYLGYLMIVNLFSRINVKEFMIKTSNDVVTLLSFVVSSYLFTWIIIGKDIFITSYMGIKGSLVSVAGISQTKIWPNVYSSVAELNAASFNTIVNSVGGDVVFLIAMLGLVFLTIDFKSSSRNVDLMKRGLILFSIVWFLMIIGGNMFLSLTANYSKLFLVLLFIPVGIGLVLSLFNKNTSSKLFLTMLLGIWMAGTIYMSLNGVRFILLLAPAFAIAFAFGLYYISKVINYFVVEEFSIEKKTWKFVYGFLITGIIFVMLFMPMKTQAIAISEGTTPNFDDAWYSTMYKIRDNSSEDAIITSWWDFGHFFAAISGRGVTFDGGSQTTPQAHWVGKLLMENDEEKAIDILRMLVCGGNNAFDYMLEKSSDNTGGVKINKLIYSTFGEDVSVKRELIESYEYYDFSANDVDNIMAELYCENPREDFLITSEDMVGKAGVWAHWGSWDFTRKYVHDNYNSKSVEDIAVELDENVSLVENYVSELKAIDLKADVENIKREDLINRWFADYPSYIPIQGRYSFACEQKSESLLVCQNGISVDIVTGKVSSNFGEDVKFANLVVPNIDSTLRVVEQDALGDVDVILIPSSNGYSVMLAQSPLGASLFTRLFYMNGFSTTHFELFDSVQSMTGVKVLTWNVNWDVGVEEDIDVELDNLVDEELDYLIDDIELEELLE